MRTLTVAGFVLLLCACQQWPSCRIDQFPGFPLGPSSHRLIAVGDNWQKARERILASGAEDISRNIGALPIGFWMYWFRLKDGTCLCVSVPSPEEDVIQGLELGDAGRGYGDKTGWFDKDRHVQFVDLDEPYGSR